MRARSIVLLLLVAGCASGGGALPTTGAPATTTTLVVGTTLGGAGSADFSVPRDESGVSTTIAAPVDSVWNALWLAYQDLGITPGTVSTERRILGQEGLEPEGGRLAGLRTALVLTCGTSPTGAPLAQTYRVRASVVSTLAAGAAGETRLTTRLLGTAASREVANTTVSCGSTGRLEAQIASRVRERLRP